MTVNNVSAISDAIKYVNGTPITQETTSIGQDISSSVFSPMTGVFALTGALGTTKDAYETVNGAMSKGKGLGKITSYFTNRFEAAKWAKDATLNKAGYIVDKTGQATKTLVSKNPIAQLKNVFSEFEESGAKKVAEKASKGGGFFSRLFGKTATNAAETGAKELAETTATKSGGFFSKLFGKTATKAAETGAKEVAETAATKSGGFLSKLFGKTATTAAETGAKEAATALAKKGGTGILSKAKNIVKGSGAGFMVGIDCAMGLITDVIPAFQAGGVESGVKQIGKTAVKAVGTAVGWTGGSAVGQALGSAIGSIFGPLGTFIGGGIGKVVGGFVGSAVAGKVAEKITGKSEVEKIQEQQTEEAAQQIASDPTQLQQLNALVEQQVQSDIANGTVTKDTELMSEYLNNVTANGMQYTTTNPVTGGVTNWLNDSLTRIYQGDSSIYNISDEKLNSVFANSDNTTSAFATPNSYNGTTDTSNTAQNQVINYYEA